MILTFPTDFSGQDDATPPHLPPLPVDPTASKGQKQKPTGTQKPQGKRPPSSSNGSKPRNPSGSFHSSTTQPPWLQPSKGRSPSRSITASQNDDDDDDDEPVAVEERKHRKNLKERERRMQVNKKFEELATVLNVTRKNKSDKVSVLIAAIDQLQVRVQLFGGGAGYMRKTFAATEFADPSFSPSVVTYAAAATTTTTLHRDFPRLQAREPKPSCCSAAKSGRLKWS